MQTYKEFFFSTVQGVGNNTDTRLSPYPILYPKISTFTYSWCFAVQTNLCLDTKSGCLPPRPPFIPPGAGVSLSPILLTTRPRSTGGHLKTMYPSTLHGSGLACLWPASPGQLRPLRHRGHHKTDIGSRGMRRRRPFYSKVGVQWGTRQRF